MKQLLAVVLASSALHPMQAGMVFKAEPGTNTLQIARDAVRAWRAAGHVDEPAIIRLQPGEYSLAEPLLLTAEDGREVWEAATPTQTLISGGQHLTGLVADAAGLWHTQSPWHFGQLYVNDRRALRAQAPAEGFFPIHAVHQEELANGRANLTISVPAEAVAALPENPAELAAVELLVFHNWDTSRYLVTACDRSAGTITVQGDKMTQWNPWTDKSWFRLENLPSTLSQPGRWHLGAGGELTYAPMPGERSGTAELVAPVIDQFLRLQGAADVRFTGLRFYHAAFTLAPGGDPPVQAAAMLGAAIEVDNSRNIFFEKIEIEHIGNYGLWFRQGVQDGRIEHSLLADFGGGGIRIGEMDIREEPVRQTSGVVVDNNILRGYGRDHPSAVGIWIGQSANNRITHNDIGDGFYTGISAGWTWGYGPSLATNNFIGFNRIHKIGQGVLSDMGGIYTLGVSPGSAEIGNVIYDVRARDYGGWGIYPDEGSTGWRIESNLVWNCTCLNPDKGGAFHQHYGSTNRLANNVFAFSSGPPMQATRVEDHLSFTLDHNLILSSNAPFFTGPWTKLHYDSGSNVFVYVGAPRPLYPTGDLASWQQAGHETGSSLTNLIIEGTWPDITLPHHSAAESLGFRWFDPKAAGVYGERDWRQQARNSGQIN